MVKKVAAILAVVFALVPASALATSSNPATTTVYGGEAAPTVNNVAPTTKTIESAVAPTNETLPFTGVDLGLVVVAGVGLIIMGVSLRRISRGSRR